MMVSIWVAIGCLFVGSVGGVFLMCLLQINKSDDMPKLGPPRLPR